jgi:hypothetical protein
MNKQLTFLLMLFYIFLCSINAFSKELHEPESKTPKGEICGGNCMVVPLDKLEEENPDTNPESKTPNEDWREYEYWENGKIYFMRFWENGKLKTKIHFKNGKPGGLGTEWYESGKKKSEGHFKNGKLNGLVTQWYETGKKKFTSYYKKGIENGLRKEWDEDGNLTFQGNFVDGNEE